MGNQKIYNLRFSICDLKKRKKENRKT